MREDGGSSARNPPSVSDILVEILFIIGKIAFMCLPKRFHMFYAWFGNSCSTIELLSWDLLKRKHNKREKSSFTSLHL